MSIHDRTVSPTIACLGLLLFGLSAGCPDDGDGGVDLDEDLWPAGKDCDDEDPDRNPSAVEKCDFIDNDCDGQHDEGVTHTFYRDSDFDGFGDGAGATLEGCAPPIGWVYLVGDCDDKDPQVYPGAEEVGDGVDKDCDGQVDCEEDTGQGCAPASESDCSDGVDDDDDGQTDCEDHDCSSACFTWYEVGTATVVPNTSYSGQAEWRFFTIAGQEICTTRFDVNGTGPLTTCEGCDFAFGVERVNPELVSGDCGSLPDTVEPYPSPGASAGYGFDGDYIYEGLPISAFMVQDTEWTPVPGNASLVGDQFQYSVEWKIDPP